MSFFSRAIPLGYPLIGNLVDLVKYAKEGDTHHLFRRWSKQHGEIFRVSFGSQKSYYLNSDKVVKAVMDKKSATTSGRPRWISSSEHMTNSWNVLLLDAAKPRWKQHRKIVNSSLTDAARADDILPYLHYESAKFLSQVANSEQTVPHEQLFRMILRYTYSVLSLQMFGMDVPENEDRVIDDIHETGAALILGTLLEVTYVDTFPLLDRLPLAFKPWEKRDSERFHRDVRFCMEKVERIREEKPKGVSQKAFLPRIVSSGDLQGFENLEEASLTALGLIFGGADTSAISTWSFLEAMLLFPDVQGKARKLIHEVVGDRMPVYEDLHEILYVRCLTKETWRWRPPVPLGHPHVTKEDVDCEGCRIPKVAKLYLNAYAIGHDEKRHYDPDSFVPERYQKDTTTAIQSMNLADATKRDHFAFGSGRRACPGYHLTERSLSIIIMRILSTFEICPPADAELPLSNNKFEGGLMPGSPDERMPISFRLLDGRKEVVSKYFDDAKTSWPAFLRPGLAFLAEPVVFSYVEP
ncbi:hypothetical protein CSAL01_04786 [Colletotrichum salicis]|uniref:Cytochrome P450 n=1 Tax=Colletotrichum salicis TaxID=1209931 RepID=A0A135V2A9_9PEZI|nr:hypothetical protein CSAL01_04786 [Colletotrichum salicis]